MAHPTTTAIAVTNAAGEPRKIELRRAKLRKNSPIPVNPVVLTRLDMPSAKRARHVPGHEQAVGALIRDREPECTGMYGLLEGDCLLCR
jgi:hypothetical protein